MSDQILVATKKGLFSIERSGGWRVIGPDFAGSNVATVLSDRRDGSAFAALALGHFGAKLHRRNKGESSWTEITAPAYPEKPKDVDDRDPFRGVPIPWNTELIWSLEAGGDDQPGRLWCGTIPGGLFRSEDRGESWELVRSLWDRPERKAWFGGGYDFPGIHSIAVHPQNSGRVWLGISCGGVWATEDDGESWELRGDGMRAEYMPPESQFDPNIQDPHRLVQCPDEPDWLWVQHHNGVFRSIDSGGSWEEILNVPPSRFGFTVAVHPRDPQTAWLVPAISDQERVPVDGKIVVTRTRDGGHSWEVLSQGLPQSAAFDLTYRHGLDVDETGERLAFGTTTGSLWLSEDHGDSWTTISEHLPPINGVRFVKS